MKFARTHLHNKTKFLAVSAILASAMFAALLFGIAKTGSTGADSDFVDVAVKQTIERESVAVTLESLQLGEDETRITYSYSASSEGLVEPLGLPKINLPDGNQLEAIGGGAFDGETHSVTRTFELPPVPKDLETILVDLVWCN